MSWGWMPPATGNRIANCERELNEKEPDQGIDGPRIVLIQMPGPWNQTGSTFTGIKPGFPLGYEPDYSPLASDTRLQGCRFDWPCRGDWESSTGQTAAEPEGQDSTPPQQNAL